MLRPFICATMYTVPNQSICHNTLSLRLSPSYEICAY